jgi:hypothetical protein
MLVMRRKKMANKKVLVVILAIFIAGGAFAQEEAESSMSGDYGSMPMNTITVDIGPMIIGLGIGAAGKMISEDEDGVSSSGFGIGVQYERQIFDKLSAAFRFAYLGGGIGYTDAGSSFAMKINSLSFEGHARYYPWAANFFLDGMLGLAIMSIGFDGTWEYEDGERKGIDFSVSRSFFKIGAKIGWRIDFGNPGGFVFEPSFGYYAGLGLGDTLGQKLSKEIGEDVTDLDDIFSLASSLIFVGGPRLSLAFGWRF